MAGRRNRLAVVAAALAFSSTAVHGGEAPVRVRIESPASGAKIPWNVASVCGLVEGPERLGVVVNGLIARVGRDRAGRRIFCAEVPLTSGEETITASATALDGGGADDSIRVISSGEPVPVRMTADRNVGAPPLGVRFVVAVESDASYAPPTIDFDGDGEIDATVTERRATLTHTYPTVGLHRARLRSQSRGREITREVVLEVRDEKAVVAALQELWREFRAALIGGEVDRALSLVVASSRQKASELIRGASEHGVDLRPVYGDVEVMLGTVYPDFAELQAVHTAPGAAPVGSGIQFSRDVDGNWRIKTF